MRLPLSPSSAWSDLPALAASNQTSLTASLATRKMPAVFERCASTSSSARPISSARFVMKHAVSLKPNFQEGSPDACERTGVSPVVGDVAPAPFRQMEEPTRPDNSMRRRGSMRPIGGFNFPRNRFPLGAHPRQFLPAQRRPPLRSRPEAEHRAHQTPAP